MASVKLRQELERRIVGQFVKDALAAGKRLSVSLERGYDIQTMEENKVLGSTDYDRIMEEAFAGDECHVFVHDADGPLTTNNEQVILSAGWVYLVFGNDGYDVISDYMMSIEPLLKPAMDIADQYS